MSTLNREDLTAVEQTYLGVLALGLVSADQAHDDRFRTGGICARTQALLEAAPAERYLDGDGQHAAPPFREALREAIIELDRKGIIGLGPPRDLVVLTPSPESREAAYATLDIDRNPPIFDRYLAQRCMDALLSRPEIHAYLMGLYADSSDVWHELYQRGKTQWR
ncbi:MAG TPA: hypothetical protein VKV26_21035 [Dehalococcoidia bacterium]|nr:hypothetical protein [Dehalococcoidia bacterium]